MKFYVGEKDEFLDRLYFRQEGGWFQNDIAPLFTR